jgi:hypothetical protein
LIAFAQTPRLGRDASADTNHPHHFAGIDKADADVGMP